MRNLVNGVSCIQYSLRPPPIFFKACLNLNVIFTLVHFNEITTVFWTACIVYLQNNSTGISVITLAERSKTEPARNTKWCRKGPIKQYCVVQRDRVRGLQSHVERSKIYSNEHDRTEVVQAEIQIFQFVILVILWSAFLLFRTFCNHFFQTVDVVWRETVDQNCIQDWPRLGPTIPKVPSASNIKALQLQHCSEEILQDVNPAPPAVKHRSAGHCCLCSYQPADSQWSPGSSPRPVSV